MHTPPPFVQAIEYHTLKQVNKNGKRVYETPSGTTPSVTTILSKTKDQTAKNKKTEQETRSALTQ